MPDLSQLSPTTIVAIYAAVIATLSLLLSGWLGIAELRRHRADVSIETNLGVLIDGNGESSEPFIMVDAINTGSGPVVINAVGWIQKDGSKHQYINPYMLELPRKLNERRKLTFYYACRWFRDFERSDDVRYIYFRDETGKYWKSRIRRRQIRKWKAETNEGWRVMWDQSSRHFYRDDGDLDPHYPEARLSTNE